MVIDIKKDTNFNSIAVVISPLTSLTQNQIKFQCKIACQDCTTPLRVLAYFIIKLALTRHPSLCEVPVLHHMRVGSLYISLRNCCCSINCLSLVHAIWSIIILNLCHRHDRLLACPAVSSRGGGGTRESGRKSSLHSHLFVTKSRKRLFNEATTS